MKKILILLFCVVCISCSKKKTCWKCTLNVAGTSGCPTVKEVCSNSDNLPADAYKDCNGNDNGGVCVKE